MEYNIPSYCNPCHCSTNNNRIHYFYSEATPVKDNAVQKQPRSRPSSANSVKSSRGSKKILDDSSKNAASDSKIIRPKKFRTKIKLNSSLNKKEKSPAVNSECAEQLKEELRVIKEQLFFLSERKQETLDVSSGLEMQYTNLKEQCANQEKQIEELKTKNAKLAKKIKEQQTREEEDVQKAITTKTCLDNYEEKLSTLYEEFVETSKVMEESRERMCRCIKQKAKEFESIISTKNNSKLDESGTVQDETLRVNSPERVENEGKFLEKNEEMSQTITELENQLHEALNELEKSHKQASIASKKHRQEMVEINKRFEQQMQNKTKEIDELKSKILADNPPGCRCLPCKHKLSKTSNMLQVKYDQLQNKYKHVTEKLNLYQQASKKRTEELQMLKQNENELLTEYVNLQGFCEQLTKINNEHAMTMARLNSSVHERDTTIQCLKSELASKNKQIELLLKNEDRLKKKVIDLQEELVSMQMASNPTRRNYESEVMCPEECSIHLTDELEDLIDALYEEIDKTLEKDEQIHEQAKEICCLRCAMSVKDKELSNIRNELKTLERRFNMTLQQKEACHFQNLAQHPPQRVRFSEEDPSEHQML